jgi:signal transduction histidine kinase
MALRTWRSHRWNRKLRYYEALGTCRKPAAGRAAKTMDLFKRANRPIDLLRYAGLITWLCAGIPLLIPHLVFERPLAPSEYLVWALLYLLFGFLYWNYLRYVPGRTSLARRLAYLSVLTACALGTGLASYSAIGGVLLLVVSGLLPWMLSSPPAVVWLLAQNLLLTLVIARIPDVSTGEAVVTAGLYLGLALFVFIGSLAAVRQNQSRDELRKLNHELMATQALLAENTRIAERVRIARELHDLVGHHLTALTLNLEVVTHLASGKVLEHVEQAHSLAKLLLADVREVVNDMREDDMVDLAEALRTLVEGVPEPQIHLDLPSELVLTDPQRAQVLLRCAQEIITNSVRHARAGNLWIRVSMTPEGVAMSARDDGRGVARVHPGNGLRGMSERITQLGGKLEIESGRGAGFTLHAYVPVEAA